MRKKLAALLLAAVVLAALTPSVLAASSAIGFVDEGNYSSGDPAFLFYIPDAVYIYNEESFWEGDFDYGEIAPGSVLYVPIHCTDDTVDPSYDGIADMGRITTNRVQVSYSADPDRAIRRVSIVDGSTANSDKVDSGAYVLVEFADTQADASGTSITLQLVLSVNRISEQDTRVWMRAGIRNRTEDIKRNSVYSALLPTAYRSKVYSGEAAFDFGDGVRYTANVAKGGYYYMSLNRDPVKSVEDSAGKTHTEYYTFEGDAKTFASTGQLQIPVDIEDFRPSKKADPQIYVYEIDGNTLRALDESELSFQSSTEVLTIRTRTLGSYVLSAQPLTRTVENTKNVLYTGYATDENDEPETSSGSSTAGGAPTIDTGNPTGGGAPTDTGNPIDTGNPTGGGDTIYAANTSTGNPSTSDPVPPGPILLVLLLCATVLPPLYKRAFPPARQNQS